MNACGGVTLGSGLGQPLQCRARAFVLMHYRVTCVATRTTHRTTTIAAEFWLNKLTPFNGNFVQAEMVKAFITSAEYRSRFGP